MIYYKDGYTSFFDSEANIETLQKECDSWLGTPYKHWTGVKHRGADCIHFAVRVSESTGANNGKQIIVPKYNRDWHIHRGEELLRLGLEHEFNVYRLFTPSSICDFDFNHDLRDGDLLLFQYGRHAAHIGIHIKGRVYQSIINLGVEFRDIRDKEVRERMRYGYRFKGVNQA